MWIILMKICNEFSFYISKSTIILKSFSKVVTALALFAFLIDSADVDSDFTAQINK